MILPVLDRTLVLGTWQSVVLVDPNRENNHADAAAELRSRPDVCER